MSSKIKTNKITYKLNREKIEKNYNILRICTSKKNYFGTYILDAPSLNNDVQSVNFEYRKNASGPGNWRSLLVLMDKEKMEGENRRKIKKTLIDTDKNGEDLSVEYVDIDDIEHDNVLLQLLLNALSSFELSSMKANNLTGHLYCYHPAWNKSRNDIIYQIPCLEFKITKDYILKMNVRTFTSINKFKEEEYSNKPKYVLSNKNDTLRRYLSDDKNKQEEIFIMRQFNGTKRQITFLDVKNKEKFDQCKVGMMLKIKEVFNEKYKSKAEIHFDYFPEYSRYECSKSLVSVRKENRKKVIEMLKAKNLSVHIVDKNNDDNSAVYIDNLRLVFEENYGIKATIGKRDKKDALNIRVIHNADYYNGKNDPHNHVRPGMIVQHITIDDFPIKFETKKDGSERSTTATNAAIASILNESLIKFDIESEEITLFDWQALGYEESMTFGVDVKDGGHRKYVFMKIYPDGSFKFQEPRSNLLGKGEYQDCIDAFENTEGNIKGLIKNEQGRINIIKDTDLITLPEEKDIRDLLVKGDTRLRNEQRRELLFSSTLDIKTFKENGKQYYSVGIIGKGMDRKIQRASNIRCIEGYQDAPLMFDKLLPTMDMAFVRNGQLTVLPFPFKYLREYVAKQKAEAQK